MARGCLAYRVAMRCTPLPDPAPPSPALACACLPGTWGRALPVGMYRLLGLSISLPGSTGLGNHGTHKGAGPFPIRAFARGSMAQHWLRGTLLASPHLQFLVPITSP